MKHGIEKLKDIDLSEKPTAKKLKTGLTPSLTQIVIAALLEENPAALASFNEILEQENFDWNGNITEGTHKGQTPLFILMKALDDKKLAASSIFSKIIDKKDLDWTIGVSNGPEKGMTPIVYLQRAIIFSIKDDAISKGLAEMIKRADLNWNAPIGDLSPLYVLMKWIAYHGNWGSGRYMARQNEIVTYYISQLLTKEGLSWNVKTQAGTTPLFWLMVATAAYQLPEVLTLLHHLTSKTNLDWHTNCRIPFNIPNTEFTGVKIAQTSPLYWLLTIVFKGLASWHVLTPLIKQGTLTQDSQIEKLHSVQKAALPLWISLYQAECLFNDKKLTELAAHFNEMASLAHIAFNEGYRDAYLLIVEFLLDCQDAKSAQQWFEKIPREHCSYSSANLVMLKFFQKSENLEQCLKFANNIPPGNKHYASAQIALANLKLAKLAEHCPHMKEDLPEERQRKKVMNQGRREQAWRAIEPLLPLQSGEAQDTKLRAAFLYIYNARLSRLPHDSDAQIINIVSAEPPVIKSLLDRCRTVYKHEKKCRK